MTRGHEIYWILVACAVAFLLLRAIPAIVRNEKERLREEERRQRVSNDERRKEEIHRAKLAQIQESRKESLRARSGRRFSDRNNTASSSTPSVSINDLKPKRAKDPKDGLVGELMDFGSANYKHRPKESESFFVTILCKDGEKTLWGLGLRDAVNDFSVGQVIRLVRGAKEQVTVHQNLYDDDDNVVGTKPVQTYRQSWFAEAI
ncbi:hypothetical protein AB9X29_003745 [Vibrio vulnificus]